MSERRNDGTAEQHRGEETSSARRRYEPPKLVRLGNARELLAGASGTQPDGPPVGPIIPTRGPG